MEKLLLLDSNSLLHRAYYALPGLTDSKGNPTGAIFGFVSMLARLIKEEKPTHIAAAFDLKAPTFRHNMYSGYKATRKPMPEELVKQVPVLKKLIGDLGIKIVELEGYEADDIIGTLAKSIFSSWIFKIVAAAVIIALVVMIIIRRKKNKTKAAESRDYRILNYNDFMKLKK